MPTQIIESNKELLEAIPRVFKRIYNNREDNVSIDKIKKEYEAICSQMNGLLDEYQAELRRYERLEKNTVSDLRKTLSNICNRLITQTHSVHRACPSQTRRRASEGWGWR